MKFLIFFAIFLIGCVDKEGIYFKYYKECDENYELYGVYKKKCHPNIIFGNKNITKRCISCN